MFKAIVVLFLSTIFCSFSAMAQESISLLSQGKFPGDKPEVFAPGVVSTRDGHEFCCSWSSDGKELYFNRGMKIMVTRYSNGEWSHPVPAEFAKGYVAHEANVTPDNSRIFWGMKKKHPKNKPEHLEYGIWTAQRTSSGWGEARYVDYSMYVTSTLNGQLYLTELKEHNSIARTQLQEDGFTKMIKQTGGMLAPAAGRKPGRHPYISKHGEFIVFDSYDKNGENGKLYICFREGKDAWSRAIDLGEEINFAENICPTLSPDGKYLFYHGKSDIYWVKFDLEKYEKIWREHDDN
jgi:hypothetical protein